MRDGHNVLRQHQQPASEVRRQAGRSRAMGCVAVCCTCWAAGSPSTEAQLSTRGRAAAERRADRKWYWRSRPKVWCQKRLGRAFELAGARHAKDFLCFLGGSEMYSSRSFDWCIVIGTSRPGRPSNRLVIEFFWFFSFPVSRGVPAGTPRAHPEVIRHSPIL